VKKASMRTEACTKGKKERKRECKGERERRREREKERERGREREKERERERERDGKEIIAGRVSNCIEIVLSAFVCDSVTRLN